MLAVASGLAACPAWWWCFPGLPSVPVPVSSAWTFLLALGSGGLRRGPGPAPSLLPVALVACLSLRAVGCCCLCPSAASLGRPLWATFVSLSGGCRVFAAASLAACCLARLVCLRVCSCACVLWRVCVSPCLGGLAPCACGFAAPVLCPFLGLQGLGGGCGQASCRARLASLPFFLFLSLLLWVGPPCRRLFVLLLVVLPPAAFACLPCCWVLLRAGVPFVPPLPALSPRWSETHGLGVGWGACKQSSPRCSCCLPAMFVASLPA